MINTEEFKEKQSSMILPCCPWKSCSSELFLSSLGFPGGSDGKESACNAGDLGSVPGLGRSPGGEHYNPLQYSCLKNPHGQRSLVGYSPWGCRVGHDWAMKHTQPLTVFYFSCLWINYCFIENKADTPWLQGSCFNSNCSCGLWYLVFIELNWVKW